ncbi:hypothetical protein AVEN_241522-1 [Araneus ventricosus]|uniref:Uncharacterized protein n=1 Tax=Araneus ventricosus TaxID=182803 RepID=A0A4Y2KYX9_ARAVE|nr:hypothetical protein AVEN_241522-1 [Araneus ventricosus]
MNIVWPSAWVILPLTKRWRIKRFQIEFGHGRNPLHFLGVKSHLHFGAGLALTLFEVRIALAFSRNKFAVILKRMNEILKNDEVIAKTYVQDRLNCKIIYIRDWYAELLTKITK